jgi:pyruvate dehydrogenase E2 component (dihydrolipoamide acetyltransferase)
MDKHKHDHFLIDITMPALGADMQDGSLIEWLIKPGDSVTKGQIIAVIETNKGAIEMESYHQGTISELLVEPVIKLPVGSVLARMESDTPVTATTDSNVSAAPVMSEIADITKPEVSPTPQQPMTERTFASPLARKAAYQSGIDLTSFTGSGPQGAVLLRDINAHQTSETKLPVAPTEEPKQTMSPMRQAISDAMSRSKREIPHYYLSLEINLSKAQQWLIEQNQQREPEQRLLLPALLLTVIARQLSRFPDLNGFYTEGNFTPSAEINIGNTISLREGGLVIPAILGADQLTPDQIMDALRDLAERSRRGRLRSSEISQGTITVTSIGERGADSITGVIYPPQVAIIGLGRLRQAPVINGDQLKIGDVMTVTLAADHRVTDGITGARFLHSVAKQLQHPEDL